MSTADRKRKSILDNFTDTKAIVAQTQDGLMTVVGLVAAPTLAKVINNKVLKTDATSSTAKKMIAPAIMLGLGAIGPNFLEGNAKRYAKQIANGVIAWGALEGVRLATNKDLSRDGLMGLRGIRGLGLLEIPRSEVERFRHLPQAMIVDLDKQPIPANMQLVF